MADEELEVYTQKAAPPIAAAAIPPMSRVLLLLGAGVLGGTSVEYLRKAGLRTALRCRRAAGATRFARRAEALSAAKDMTRAAEQGNGVERSLTEWEERR